MGCPPSSLDLIAQMTRPPGQSREAYIKAMDDRGWRLKQDDTADNASPDRVESLRRTNPSKAEELARRYEQDALWRAEVTTG